MAPTRRGKETARGSFATLARRLKPTATCSYEAMIGQTTIRRFEVRAAVLAFGLPALSCSLGQSTDRTVPLTRQQPNVATETAAARPDIDLPAKTVRQMPNGSIRMDGHWVLRTCAPPLKSSELPFAAQPLNSTVIECSASTRTCQEYRATV